MVGVFAAATARLTPEFLESFDPEKLASKFVKVEREFGVKFTKSKSTFNIVGHWDAVRNAHRSLLKLKFNEKFPGNSSKRNEKFKETNTVTESPVTEVTTRQNFCETEEQLSDDALPLVRGKGNPKRGRHAPKESVFSAVPEPVFFLQYQDKTFTDAESLDIDSVLEDFEKSQLDKKVTKEELKKILEKNKDQMGKPLEKGIPKGAIIPVPKTAEQNCESFASQTSASSSQYAHLDQNNMNNCSYTTTEEVTPNSSVTSVESISSAMVTTYSVNTRMSAFNMEMITNECVESEADACARAVGQINVEDFYNQSVHQNGRLIPGVFVDNPDSAQEQGQLPDSETDSFCNMFENYDPQSMLNPIPPSETNFSRSDGETSIKSAGVKPAGSDTNIQNQNESNEVTIKGNSVSCEMKSMLVASPLPGELGHLSTNGAKTEMSGFEEMDSNATLEQLTEMSASSSKLQMLQNSSSSPNFANIPMTSDTQSDNTNKNSSILKTSYNQSGMDLAVDGQVSLQTDVKTAAYPTNTEIHKEFKTVPEKNHALDNTASESVAQDKDMLVESKKNNMATKSEDMKILTNQLKGVIDLEDRESTEMATGNSEEVNKNYEMGALVEKENQSEDIVSEISKGSIKTKSTESVGCNEKERKGQDKGRKSKTPKQSRTDVKAKTSKKTDMVKKKRERKPKSNVAEKKVENIPLESKQLVNKETANDPAIKFEILKEPKQSAQMLDHLNIEQSNVLEKTNKRLKRKGKKSQEDTNEKIYKCTECDYLGYRKKRLAEHMGRVHGLLANGTQPENPMFTCDDCGKTFVFEKDLNRHKKIVHHGQIFVCLICHKNYKSKYVFDRHTVTHEEGYIQPKFRCQICEREFTTKFSLSSHIKSEHLGMKKTYSCPTCGKTFSQIRSYRQHANVHAGIRPYTCEVCGKSFTYDKSLKEHRYMHDTVRRFQCTVCQKAFRQQTCLLIHMKTHKEKKDHICSVCGREFTQKQSLLRHERIHTGDKPYSCKICFKSFGDYAVIRKHVMMAHKRSKDSWKDEIFTEEKKRSSHYIDGGPGYVPRESFAEQHQKNQPPVIASSASGCPVLMTSHGQAPHLVDDPLQQGYGNSLEDATQKRHLDTEMSASNEGDFNSLPNMYQASPYTETLDFAAMETLKSKQENFVNIPLNYSLIQNVGGDPFNSIGSQQANMDIRSYPCSLTVSPVVKNVATSGDAYVAQFLNSPATSSVSMETRSVAMTELQEHMINSSASNVPVASSDSSLTAGTVSTTNSWIHPGFSAAYFSPSSFSQYQPSTDT